MNIPGSLAALAALLAATCAAPAMAQTEEPQVMLIFDSSGSMKKRIGARSKMEIARDAIASFVLETPGDVPLGLMAYGHRRAKDCSDIEVLIEPQPMTGPSIEQAVDAMRPRGETPIAASLRQAAAYLETRTSVPTVVIVTDGEEACNADPCAAARELKAAEVEFRAHVVGFGLNERQSRAVKCVADETGGQFIAASDAVTLASALRRVVPAEPEVLPQPVADRTIWFDDFDGDALGEEWTVQNRDEEQFVVDGGELITINQRKHDGPKSKGGKNLFVAEVDVPRGDWDLQLQGRFEFSTGRDAAILGLTDGEGGAIYATTWSWSSCGKMVGTIAVRQYKDYKIAAEGKNSYFGGCTANKYAYAPTAKAFAERPTTLTLHKRGRKYYASIDNGPYGEAAETTSLTLLRAPRKIAFGVWKYEDASGDTVLNADWIKLTKVD